MLTQAGLSMINSISTSSYALNQSLNHLQSTAQDVTQDRDLKNIERNSVKLIETEHQVSSLVQNIKTADEMMGTIINLKV